MKANRVDEYHKHGCNFYGKLVVVDFMQDAQADPKWGTFGGDVSLDYYAKAKKLVAEREYKVVRELLGFPEYVVEVK